MKPVGSLQARDKIGKKLGYCDREGGAQETVLKLLVFQMPCANPLAVMDGLSGGWRMSVSLIGVRPKAEISAQRLFGCDDAYRVYPYPLASTSVEEARSSFS